MPATTIRYRSSPSPFPFSGSAAGSVGPSVRPLLVSTQPCFSQGLQIICHPKYGQFCFQTNAPPKPFFQDCNIVNCVLFLL